MEDIDFLFDDSHLEKQELEKIAKTAEEEPVKRDFNAVILKKFVLAIIKTISEKKPEILVKKEIPKQFLQKKAEEKMVPSILKTEKPIPVAPIEIPKPEFMEYAIIKNAEQKTLANARIKDHTYFLTEPALNDKDKELLKKLTDDFVNKFIKKPELVNDKNFMIRIVQKLSNKFKIQFSPDYFDKIRYYVVRNIIGYGPIDPLIQDKNIKEIHFTGLHKPLQIKFNEEFIETNIILDNMQDVNNIVKRFFDKTKQKLTKENNYIDNDILGFQIKAFYDFNLNESKFDIKK